MENRLTKCSTSVSLVNYSYDGLGRKVKSKEINLTTGKNKRNKIYLQQLERNSRNHNFPTSPPHIFVFLGQ